MIDWGRLRALRADVGEAGFAELAALFLAEAEEAVNRLCPGASAAAMVADLHFLKGAALNLGFATLAALCGAGENRAAAGDTGIDLGAVRAAFVSARAEFDAGLAAVLAA